MPSPGITGVKNVTSTVTDGLSTTVVEFRMEVPTDKAVQDAKDAIDQIRGDLPGEIEAPIVTRIDVEGQAIMTFAVSAPDMTMEELSAGSSTTPITRALQGQPGIGRVDRYRRGRPRDPGRARPGQAGQLRHHRAGGQRADRARPTPTLAPAELETRHRRAGDPHAGRQRHGREPGRHHHRAALGPLRASWPTWAR